MGVCLKVAVLNFGELIALGSPEEVKSNSLVIEAYLGKDKC
jgi:branched-chain amino acid transport system ATP-binding protein